MYGQMSSAVNHYQQVQVQSSVFDASPHRLISMLLDGAIEKIASAKGFLQQGNINKKGEMISWAISIVDGLRASLDSEKGGEIAENLDALYEYINNRLLQANVENSDDMLNECALLLREVKVGWDGIAETSDALNARHDASAGMSTDGVSAFKIDV